MQAAVPPLFTFTWICARNADDEFFTILEIPELGIYESGKLIFFDAFWICGSRGCRALERLTFNPIDTTSLRLPVRTPPVDNPLPLFLLLPLLVEAEIANQQSW